jgi:hypothetical protein
MTSKPYTTHMLKVEPPYFAALADGSKPFEVRRNDRAYQRGDLLVLREWHSALAGVDGCHECRRVAKRDHYTGSEVQRRVTFVYAGDPRWPHALGLGVVVLGLQHQPSFRCVEANCDRPAVSDDWYCEPHMTDSATSSLSSVVGKADTP